MPFRVRGVASVLRQQATAGGGHTVKGAQSLVVSL